MATCKDCFHIDICDKLRPIEYCLDKTCSNFKNKTDVKPVKYAYWDWQHDGTHFCSECGTDALFNYEGEEFCSLYCHHCGAVMKEIKEINDD